MMHDDDNAVDEDEFDLNKKQLLYIYIYLYLYLTKKTVEQTPPGQSKSCSFAISVISVLKP